mmetsp:Transcript_10520/g.33630  ORF Transcript_10520/g.33630 Transcript_10520/m.33630 type:complete len:228 (+) Transcript_10520:531-1214(+)
MSILAALLPRPAEGDPVQDGAVVPQARRLADDDAGRVIDQQPMADGGRRVDVDAPELRGPVLQAEGLVLRLHRARRPQLRRDAVGRHRVEPLDEEDAVQERERRRVAYQRRAHVEPGLLVVTQQLKADLLQPQPRQHVRRQPARDHVREHFRQARRRQNHLVQGLAHQLGLAQDARLVVQPLEDQLVPNPLRLLEHLLHELPRVLHHLAGRAFAFRPRCSCFERTND